MSVVLTFWSHGMNFSLLPLIGTIGLSGVVVNASIVMVDSVHQAQHRLAAGASEEERRETIIEALVTRTFMLGEANPLADWEEPFDGGAAEADGTG